MFLCGFISHSFAILSKTMAMPNLFRATLLKERVVVRSPFMLCLSTQSTPLPNRRHWDDLRVSVWTLPLMTSVTARLLEQHELPLWCGAFALSHVHRMKTLRDVAFLTPSEHRIIETVLSLDGRNHLWMLQKHSLPSCLFMRRTCVDLMGVENKLKMWCGVARMRHNGAAWRIGGMGTRNTNFRRNASNPIAYGSSSYDLLRWTSMS